MQERFVVMWHYFTISYLHAEKLFCYVVLLYQIIPSFRNVSLLSDITLPYHVFMQVILYIHAVMFPCYVMLLYHIIPSWSDVYLLCDIILSDHSFMHSCFLAMWHYFYISYLHALMFPCYVTIDVHSSNDFTTYTVVMDFPFPLTLHNAWTLSACQNINAWKWDILQVIVNLRTYLALNICLIELFSYSDPWNWMTHTHRQTCMLVHKHTHAHTQAHTSTYTHTQTTFFKNIWLYFLRFLIIS